MPQCPICKAAVWVGQQYCPTCDSPLPRTGGEDYFCPQCGDRLTTPEEVCQKCQDTAPEIPKIPITAQVQSRRFPSKGLGIFLGTGLIIAALLVFLAHQDTEAPQMTKPTPSQADSGPTPPAPVIPAAASTPPASPAVEVQKPPATPTPAVSTSAAETTPPAITKTSTEPTKSFPKYTVTIEELSVREGPNTAFPRIAILRSNEKVELLETSGGWGKVRDEERNILGWSYMRYLQPVGPASSAGATRHQPADPKGAETVSAKVTREIPQ